MERTGSRISLFLGKRKEVFPGLDNALCRETRFRRTTSSVKPIIDGYHSSLVYINDSMRSFTENIGNNWWYANVWMASTVNTDFFFRYFCRCADIFADMWFTGKYLHSIFFETTYNFEPREKYCDSQKNFDTFKNFVFRNFVDFVENR